jgi:hypothetical protein
MSRLEVGFVAQSGRSAIIALGGYTENHGPAIREEWRQHLVCRAGLNLTLSSRGRR